MKKLLFSLMVVSLLLPASTRATNTVTVLKLPKNVTTDSNAFITTWETTTNNEDITIPTTGTGYNYNVDWGDGTISTAQTGDASHTYNAMGTYIVGITGDFPRIDFSNTDADNRTKIKSIEQWGDIAWTSMSAAFYGCENLTINAADAPNLSNVIDMSYMFFRATGLDGDLSTWNTANVTNMKSMFNGATSFNGNVSTWNVSNVTNMWSMFFDATSFNQDLSTWNVGKVTRMRVMFNGATSFNGDVSTWNVSNVTDVGAMFEGATSFNQDLGAWDVSSVTNMSRMFKETTSFNGDVSTWNVSNVTNMQATFEGATSFNQDLGAWDISYVTEMSRMFTDVTLSISNYDNTLIGWSTLSTGETAIPTGITLDASNCKYSQEAARNTLINSYSWTINDAGLDTSLGVDDYQLSGLTIYPNPSVNTIYLRGAIDKLQQITIYSILGQSELILNKNFKEININSLKEGIHFINLISKEGKKTVKFIKE
ncbi:MAG: BspA family leucine-rich repeat surface protein [Flavobacteriaceae bacterium]